MYDKKLRTWKDEVIFKEKEDKYKNAACFASCDYESDVSFFVVKDQMHKTSSILYLKHLLFLNKVFPGLIDSVKSGFLKQDDLRAGYEGYGGEDGYFVKVKPSAINFGNNNKLCVKIVLMLIRCVYNPSQWAIVEKSLDFYLNNETKYDYIQTIFIISKIITDKFGMADNSNHWIYSTRYDSPELDDTIFLFDISKYKTGLNLLGNLEECDVINEKDPDLKKIKKYLNNEKK